MSQGHQIVRDALLAAAEDVLRECDVEIDVEKGLLLGPTEAQSVSVERLVCLARAVSAARRLGKTFAGAA